MAATKQSKIKKQVLTIKRMIDDWQQYLAYLDANAKKLKLSTYHINVIHKSLGLWDYNGKDFQQSEKKFLQLYSS